MADKTEAWKGKFIPLDLPEDLKGKVHSGLPQEDTEKKSPLEQKFDKAYSDLESAVKERDTKAYFKGLTQLLEIMKTEVYEIHKPPSFGDMSHTFREWWRKIEPPFRDGEVGAIEQGIDVSRLTNTLDNNFNPHKDFPGDDGMRRNSESFGNDVAEYINKRGREFITGSVTPATGREVSHFQVVTTFKGFPQG